MMQEEKTDPKVEAAIKAERKKRFKAKMNGLKLTKKLEEGQLEAMLWAYQNQPEFLECLYEKKKPVDMDGFNQFKDRWHGPRHAGWTDAKKAWSKLNPNKELVVKILEGLDKRKKWEYAQKRKGVSFIPELPGPGKYIRQRYWEAEFEEESVARTNPDLTACARTARILEERERDRENRVVDMNVLNQLKREFKGNV